MNTLELRELDSQGIESINGGGAITWACIAGGAAIVYCGIQWKSITWIFSGQTCSALLDPA